MRPIRPALAIGGTCFLLALGACGDDDERAGDVTVQGGNTSTAGTETAGTETAPTGKAAETVNVSLTEFTLDPANPSIDKTGVIAFKATNDGKVVHALEVEGPEGEVETESIQPGESATLKADLSKAGTYTWYCPIGNHEQQGMKGKIKVAGGGSGGGAGTGTTEDEDKSEPKTTEDSGGSAY